MIADRWKKPGAEAALNEELLSSRPFFSVMSLAHRQRLAGCGRREVFAPRATVWHAGENAENLAVVVKGRLKLCENTGRGEVIFDIQTPGDVVGELALSSDGLYKTDLVTLRKTELLLLPMAAVRDILLSDTKATAALAMDIGSQLIRSYRRLHDLAAGSVQSRLARVVLRLAERAGEPFPDGILVPVKLRRRELAAMAATSLESVSRTLNRWHRDRLLALQPVGFVIRDYARLEKLCG